MVSDVLLAAEEESNVDSDGLAWLNDALIRLDNVVLGVGSLDFVSKVGLLGNVRDLEHRLVLPVLNNGTHQLLSRIHGERCVLL